jgi:hypothetical protein
MLKLHSDYNLSWRLRALYNQLLAQGSQSLSAALKVGAAITNQTGEAYQPQYLDAATYQSIIAGSNGQRGGNSGSSSAVGSGKTGGGRRW